MTMTSETLQATTRDAFAIGDELRGERATLGRSLLDVQRDLRIKAAYVAAIENADPAVFPNPSFISGYVRSYARYLGLDPDEVYARFCAESGFAGSGGAAGKPGAAADRPGAARASGAFRMAYPLAEPRWRGIPDLPLAAIGSLMVLLALVSGLGYGGWTVLQNIQRVQFAPVEELPMALAAVDDLVAPEAPGALAPGLKELANPVAAAALADLYRQQELEVPILAPRDGPIAAIDPDRGGLLARRDAPLASGGAGAESGPAGGVIVAAGPEPEPLLATAPEPASVTVVAERAAWIRVYLADKTILFERILETGETYSPPADVAEPLIWAGNSGSVFVRLGETLHGPLGSGTRAVRDVPLAPAAIAERYGPVETVPEAIARALAAPIEQAAVALQ